MDFLLREGGQLQLIEAEYSFASSTDFFKGIEVFRKAAAQAGRPSEGKNIVGYASDELQHRSQGSILSWQALRDMQSKIGGATPKKGKIGESLSLPIL